MPRAEVWDDGKTVAIECPGCGCPHALNISPDVPRPRWSWNGSVERPTFTPSILVRFPPQLEAPEDVCHSFVTDGRIQFLSDSTHALAGQTVDLPEVDF